MEHWIDKDFDLQSDGVKNKPHIEDVNFHPALHKVQKDLISNKIEYWQENDGNGHYLFLPHTREIYRQYTMQYIPEAPEYFNETDGWIPYNGQGKWKTLGISVDNESYLEPCEEDKKVIEKNQRSDYGK